MPLTKTEERALVEFSRIIPNVDHSEITFHEHCIGVFDILKKLGVDEELAIAGLFHASMGTEHFKIEINGIEDKLKSIIPNYSLELVKLFSTLKNRTHAIITGDYEADDNTKYAMAKIEYANLLEQSARMTDNFSDSAIAALKNILEIT
jgi:hypothetical protein